MYLTGCEGWRSRFRNAGSLSFIINGLVPQVQWCSGAVVLALMFAED